MTLVCRFAPSPNGYLHLGHALSAIEGFETAHRHGGRFLVRIEDIDTARSRDAYVAAIFEDLAWLGLTWETPVMRQSEHFGRYCELASRLKAMGVLYPCFATRAEISAAAADNPAERDPDGAPLYSGLYKYLTASEIARRCECGENYALRIDMEKALEVMRHKLNGEPLTFVEVNPSGEPEIIACRPEIWGDAIIVRKDTPTSYHLAVVADDALQGITLVTRGRDLFQATGLQRLLQVLLELPVPKYAHHRLLMGEDGRKLAKSAGDTSLRELRANGVTAMDIKKALQLV